jgi:formamidopyrimidine-DNA glycosylase
VPELPDIAVYIEALGARILNRRLLALRISNPFVLRTVEPPIEAFSGHRVMALERLGKRIAIGVEGDLWIVIHLMIAGRLHWYELESRKRPRASLLQVQFDSGLLTLTEAGTKRRASLHLVSGRPALEEHNPDGLELKSATLAEFIERMTRRNHTLKRALTDPRILSGIGNAYSDEILHRARMSPMTQTQSLSDDEFSRLLDAIHEVLREWTERLRAEAAGEFPEKVTAFREEMAVHGRYGKPCPVCGTKVQRIRYAENETNYCPRCQTGGKVLADRSLSRLLKDDWPRTIEALEKLHADK